MYMCLLNIFYVGEQSTVSYVSRGLVIACSIYILLLMLYIYFIILLQQTQQWYILAHDDWLGDDAILKEASLSSEAFSPVHERITQKRSKAYTGGSVTLHVCRRLSRRQEKRRSVT